MATIHRQFNNSGPVVPTNLSLFHQEPDLTSQINSFNCLPKQFVTSMRTLFEIMDEKRTGYIKLIDIENRWQDDQSKDVPRGLVDCLRNVTPPNGLLSFERFCIGLKICLVNNQIGNGAVLSNVIENNNKERSPSAPLLDLESNQPTKPHWSNTATVRPNNAALQTQQRTLSLPQLSPDSDSDLVIEPVPQIPGLYGPPKPPRTSLENKANTTSINSNHHSININSTNIGLDKIEIRNALQNWQMGVLKNSSNNNNPNNNNKNNNDNTQFMTRPINRGLGDGENTEILISSNSNSINNMHLQKKPSNRKREPRRHTLQNGIDYNMMKRLKQFESEKEVLMQGLSAVERTREWYMKQIANVQDKMRYLGRMGSHVEPWSESYKERTDFQRARVIEVNRQLEALINSWERGGFPIHMNLAMRHPIINETYSQDIVNQLKRQNRQLTEEVSLKSERIGALEREKANLLREVGGLPTKQGRIRSLENPININMLSEGVDILRF